MKRQRKLTFGQYNYIADRIKAGICMSALARKFDVSRQRIHQIKKETEECARFQ